MLARERVFVSVRGASIRVSPHVYNTFEDCDRLIACLNKNPGTAV
jgi:selenocysteine lyase/cysteine desulfurase